MIKKKLFLFYTVFCCSFLLILIFYQVYLVRQIFNELLYFRELKIYYIDFLNAITEQLKKKNTKLVILSSKTSFLNKNHSFFKKNSIKKKFNKKNNNKKYIKKINKKIIHKAFTNFSFEKKKSYIEIPIKLFHPMKKGTYWQSSPYGLRYNKRKKKYEFHHGVDFAAAYGTPVYAAAEGAVAEVSIKNYGFGKSILLFHGEGIKTRYAHLSKILIFHKQKVRQGDLIGLVGATGNTRGKINGSHLHFEVIINEKKNNPLFYI